jgi:putative ABC transport system substrate-binding protein
VEHPVKFDMVINARAARAIGLTVPSSVLMRADQVLE